MQFTVNKEDVETGVRASGRACALAKAFQRQGFPEAVVGSSYVYPDGYGGKMLLLPSKVEKAITRFDKGIKIRPFKFELEITKEAK